jgi:hypothetical protein
VRIVRKLHFYLQIDFIFSHAVKLLGLIRRFTSSSSVTDSLPMLYFFWLYLNWNKLLLLGTLLRLLIPITLSAYEQHFQPFATVAFFKDVEYHYGDMLEN